MTIRELIPADAHATAKLHFEGLTEDFLPGFGKSFLHILHRTLIVSPYSLAYGAFSRNKLLGFVIGTPDTTSMMKWALRASALQLLPYIVIRAVLSPRTIKYIFQTLLYGRDQTGISAELIIIVVDQSQRRKGVGTQLLHALSRKFKRVNVNNFKVGTLAQHRSSNRFYQKVGGRIFHAYRIYDKAWNVYKFSST